MNTALLTGSLAVISIKDLHPSNCKREKDGTSLRRSE
jgi:hypothetical protein